MLLWLGFRMHSEKMMEDMKENQNMLFVTTRLRRADVMDNMSRTLFKPYFS